MKVETFRRIVKQDPAKAQFYEEYRYKGKLYYRRKSLYKITRDLDALSENKRKVMLALGETSYGVFGETGLVDGTPVVAHKVSVAMKGKRFKKSDEDIAIDKLRETLRKVASFLSPMQ